MLHKSLRCRPIAHVEASTEDDVPERPPGSTVPKLQIKAHRLGASAVAVLTFYALELPFAPTSLFTRGDVFEQRALPGGGHAIGLALRCLSPAEDGADPNREIAAPMGRVEHEEMVVRFPVPPPRALGPADPAARPTPSTQGWSLTLGPGVEDDMQVPAQDGLGCTGVIADRWHAQLREAFRRAMEPRAAIAASGATADRVITLHHARPSLYARRKFRHDDEVDPLKLQVNVVDHAEVKDTAGSLLCEVAGAARPLEERVAPNPDLVATRYLTSYGKPLTRFAHTSMPVREESVDAAARAFLAIVETCGGSVR